MGEKKIGLFFRPFKGKKPIEITLSDDYQQPELIEDQQTNNNTTLSDLTRSLYNIFGVSLKEAASINDVFEDSNNFTPTFNSWESHLCQPEYQRFVPKAILKCIKFINDFGLREEGLYRVSGSKNEVDELKQNFIQYGPCYDIPPTTDVHAITSLIKMFARELPEELLPVKRHTFLAYKKSDFPSSSEMSLANFKVFSPEEEDMNPVIIPTQILQEILQSVSAHQFALLQTLTRHFSLVIENSSYNRMTLSSLSVILCPTLRMHKSVFHALILKSPNVWSHLHPIDSEISISSIKYDPRNIVEYRLKSNEQNVVPLKTKKSAFVLTTSSGLSTTDSADSFYNSSMQKSMLKHRQSLMVLRSPEEDDFFNDNISLDYNKIMIPLVEPMLMSSVSSFSDSSSNSSSSRYSDDGAVELAETLKYPLPQFSNQNTYEYRLPSKSNDHLSENGQLTPTKKHFEMNQNRRVFLRR